jgi:hypothetical protein
VRHVLILSAFLAGLVALVWGRISADPYAYDEADYMYAASLGLAANYTDTPAQSFSDFVHTGLNRGRDASQRASLSEAVRASNDVNFYRHWHGPVAFYWWMAARAGGLNEQGLRASMLAFHVMTLLAIYFGCLWILPGLGGRLAAVLCSGLYIFSYALVHTSLEIAPHGVFVACFVISLILLAKAVQTGQAKYWRMGLAPLALAFDTLEVALVLVATYGLFAWLERKRFFAGWTRSRIWQWVGVSALLLALMIVALWPGALLKLAFVKAYAFMAYLALFRKSAWGNVSLLDTWLIRLGSAPVEWALIALGVFAFVRKPLRAALPFLVFAILMLGATLRVTTDSPRYEAPFLPALLLFAGLSIANVLAERQARLGFAVVVTACLLIFADSYRQTLAHRFGPDEHSTALLSWLREHPLDGRRVLAPQADLPAIHYYFPRIQLRSYADEAERAAAEERGGIDGVLLTNGPIRYDQVSNR